MELLSILLKERDFAWQADVAKCAEYYASMNATRSSAFALALAAVMHEELEEKLKLYLEHEKDVDLASLEKFFKIQEDNLCSDLAARFSVKSVPDKDRRELLLEKYKVILSSMLSSDNTKQPIGFNSP